MSKTLIALTPEAVAARLRQGDALLIDIRETDEFARRRIAGAVSHPLSRFAAGAVPDRAGADVIFTCRSGMRTAANAARLAGAVAGDAYVLDGGVDGWARAGLPVTADRAAPIEIMRQVQIFAGSVVLFGVILGWAVSPYFFGLAAFIGAGLTFSGLSGSCAMARLLGYLPWNRPVAA